MVPKGRIELPTSSLRVTCSTNWSYFGNCKKLYIINNYLTGDLLSVSVPDSTLPIPSLESYQLELFRQCKCSAKVYAYTDVGGRATQDAYMDVSGRTTQETKSSSCRAKLFNVLRLSHRATYRLSAHYRRLNLPLIGKTQGPIRCHFENDPR